MALSLQRIRKLVVRELENIEKRSRALARPAASEIAEDKDPPVVARLVVELRSDGSRTVARGALEDTAGGNKVALEARGTSPMQLAASLTKSLLGVPLLARQVAHQVAHQVVQAQAQPSDEPRAQQSDDDAELDTPVSRTDS